MDLIYIALLLFAAGLSVTVIELFVPSAGMFGVAAAIMIISSIVVGFWDGLASGAMMLLLTVFAVPLTLAFLVNVWPHTPLGKRILIGDIKKEDVMPNSSHYKKRSDADLVGQVGVAKTKMLPSGIIIINDEKFDAVSQGFAIDAGDPIKVVDVREHRIYVEPYDASKDDGNTPSRDGDILSQPIEDFGIDALDDPLD